ncbi:MAG: twin-arginine translocase TatA/TatE family subunit [Gammaproteobacteria bacterium]|uniref:Sec-independent protein translocase protein TatA n=1 Tax=OM182 bacterium MED-G24 TaxID=1986255 RepID=A0A2A5WTA4_9GAMM|nr:twin-arginine translocase TatA/TatE family subunit [Gammaproteobacteria bacterium]PDH39712.1 MAG: twin-arginine translocase TatA/TatE family subunit [OM182 bacterium MED-G24]RPG27444.1 MAG: twin-arginine translocase TatA/TatE family subunit [Gammaproteobacteria bacterium TMED50]|tara:strand:+ start:131 stop:361 length:231 start_codon:yes stop_codon:yes gene_type:complete
MSFGVTELILVLVIVLLLFGTTKLKSLGSDLGSAIKGFRSAMDDKSEKEKTSGIESNEAREPKVINDTAKAESKQP